MEPRDYYQILRVDKNSDGQQIKEAYRKLALKYHPDRNRDNPASVNRMKEINESYAVLSDPKKRSQYDSLRETYGSSAYGHFRQTYSDHDIFRGSDIQQIFEELSKAFGMRGFNELFRESSGSAHRTFAFQKTGGFGRIFVAPSMKQGSSIPNIPLQGPFGNLIKAGLKKIWGIELPQRGKDLHDTIVIPPVLARSGGKIRYYCRITAKELLVAIPPGIRAGRQVRLKGMGEKGKGGMESGDLYIQIRLRNPLLQKLRDTMNRFLLLKRNEQA